MLLAGHTDDRRCWHDAGYVARLRDRFAVICIDLRGQGESGLPHEPAAYAVERVLDDIYAVADACGAEHFAVWGYSFGATVALHLAARRPPRLTHAVAAGSHFGRPYTEEVVERSKAQAQRIASAKAAGRLDELALTPEQRAVAERIDILAHIAGLRALASWPAIEPHDLRCPAYVYAGMDDALVTPALEPRRAEIEATGVVLRLFPGLDHVTTFTARDVTLPTALAFLLSSCAPRVAARPRDGAAG